MTSKKQASKPKQTEKQELLAFVKKSRKNMNAISEFAGGLKHVESRLTLDLKKVRSNQKSTETALETLKETQKEAKQRSRASKIQLTNLEKSLQSLNVSAKNVGKQISGLKKIKESADKSYNSIIKNVTEIKETNRDFKALKEVTVSKSKALQSEQKTLQKLLDNVKSDHDRVIEYKQELLDDKKDANDNLIPSIKTKISALHTNTENKFNEISQQKKLITHDFKDLEKILSDKINSFLPGAGAAGLASAFFDAKSRYGWVSCKAKEKEQTRTMWCAHLVWHGLSGILKHSTNHILFIVPLLGIVWLFLGMPTNLETIQENLTSMGSVTQGDNTEKGIQGLNSTTMLSRALLSIPLAILSWFGFSSIQLNRRLYEEYNYKQRVMQTYYSFEDKISDTNDQELKKRLLKIMLDVVEYKPALTMSTHQKSFPLVISDEVAKIAKLLPKAPT